MLTGMGWISLYWAREAGRAWGGGGLLLVGGVANKILNLAKCPVLIVR